MSEAIKAAVTMTAAIKQYIDGKDTGYANIGCYFSHHEWDELLSTLEALRPVAEGKSVIVLVDQFKEMEKALHISKLNFSASNT